MSAYAEYADTPFTDLDALVEALAIMNPAWTTDQIMVDPDGQLELYGYGGDNRFKATGAYHAEKCEICIPGAGHPGKPNLVGGAANDLGFTRNAEGQLVPIISGYDRGRYTDCWVNKLKATYLEAVITKKAKKQGYSVKKKVVDGKVKMTLSRWR